MRTHHLLKSATLFLLVILVSCEKETVVTEPETEPVTIEPLHNSSITTEVLSESELASLIGYIEKRTGKSVSKDDHGGTYLETEFGTIYLDHALRATDTLGKSNISFRIYPDEPQPRLIFNLVVGYAPEGQERPIYVIGLEKSEVYYAGEMAGTNSPADFSGKLHRYPIDGSILNGKNLSAKELCEPMDVNPGPEPVDDGGGGGGGNMGPGPGPGSGDGGGGVYYPCTVTIAYDNCSVGGNADGHGPQEQEGGGYCSGSPIVAVYYSGDCGIDDQMNKAATSSKGDDCPELDGPVPINIYAHIVQTLDAALDLTPQQEAFLLEPDNEPFLQDLHNFWYFSNKDVNTQNFLKEVITVLSTLNSPTPTIDSYPGNNNGFPFEWWKDESFVEQNISFTIDEGISELTDAEKLLVAIFPVQALIIRDNKLPAETEAQNRFGNNGINDKSDAFRHAFFNAMNSNDAGDAIARLFSTAHESEVPAHLSLERQMDLFNNNVGHVIGHNANFFVSDNILSNTVYQNLLVGNLVHLWPIDYNDPNFWDNPLTPEPNDGSHGISNSTQLTPSNQ